MLAAIPLGLLCGLLLGGRFKVLATIPVELAAALVIGGLATAGVASPGVAALAFVAFSLSLQFGYVAMLLAGPWLNRSRRIGSVQV